MASSASASLWASLIKKEFRQVWRSFRLPGLCLTLLSLAIMDPLASKYMGEIIARFAQGITIIVPPPTAEQAMETFLGDVGELGLLAVIAITMGSVASEKASGVSAFVVTKPVSRLTYVLAKYAVLAAGVAAGIGGSAAVAYLYTWTLLGPVQSSRACLATLAMASYAELVMTVTFSASMALPGSLAAGGMGLASMFLMGIAGSLLRGTRIGPYMPSALVGGATSLLRGLGQAGLVDALMKPLASAAALGILLWVLGFRKFQRLAL